MCKHKAKYILFGYKAKIIQKHIFNATAVALNILQVMCPAF